MSTLTSSVYVITSIDNTKIKIGKANNVLQRISAFSYATIDYDRSFEIICRDEKAAYKIEKILHLRFDDYRICPSEIGSFDGSCEWFTFDVFDRIKSFITNSGDDRVIEIRSGIKIPQKSENVKKKIYYTKQERQAIAEKKWFKEDIDNVEMINNTIDVVKKLLSAQEILFYSLQEEEYCIYLDMHAASDDLNLITRHAVHVSLNIPHGYSMLWSYVESSSKNSTEHVLQAKLRNIEKDVPANSKTLEAFLKLKNILHESCKPFTDMSGIDSKFI